MKKKCIAAALLLVTSGANAVMRLCPTKSIGFTPEPNPAPGSVNWRSVTYAVAVVWPNKQETISPLTGGRCFRLVRP